MPYEVIFHVADPVAARVDPRPFVELIERTLLAEGIDAAEVGLSFGGVELLARLNSEHRGVDGPTDVLSFPAADDAGGEDGDPFPGGADGIDGADGEPSYLGDIAVSVEMAGRQAAEAGLSLDEELRHLVVHGLLHLLGHDHETDEDDALMRGREEAMLGPRIHAAGGHERHD